MRKRLFLGFALLPLLPSAGVSAMPRTPEALGGTWALSLDRTGSSCRVMLRSQKSDSGAYFLGMPIACRHTMPALATVGRWSASGAEFAALDDDPAGALSGAAVVPVATRHRRTEDEQVESAADTVGRYAVMRGKHDTGCMLTLDSARAPGGSRAQLAPGCRDQGIVVFDPSAWQIVRGKLVLTARAGHKASLAKEGDGAWAKEAAEGGKPLGLKKL